MELLQDLNSLLSANMTPVLARGTKLPFTRAKKLDLFSTTQTVKPSSSCLFPIHSEQRIQQDKAKRDQNLRRIKADTDERKRLEEEEEERHIAIRDAKYQVKKPAHQLILAMEQRQAKHKAKWVRNRVEDSET